MSIKLKQPLNDGYLQAWETCRVTGSDFTRTAQTLADVTGLVTPTLANSTLYEFEAVLYCSTSADTNGVKFGVNLTGTGSPHAEAVYIAPAAYPSVSSSATNALNTGAGTCLTTNAASAAVIIKGTFTTGTSSAFSIQGLKVVSGTLTVYIGSILRYRKMT